MFWKPFILAGSAEHGFVWEIATELTSTELTFEVSPGLAAHWVDRSIFPLGLNIQLQRLTNITKKKILWYLVCRVIATHGADRVFLYEMNF